LPLLASEPQHNAVHGIIGPVLVGAGASCSEFVFAQARLWLSGRCSPRPIAIWNATGGVLVRLRPVVPPKVEYRLTGLGLGPGAACCGVRVWAAENLDTVEQALQGRRIETK
jgi:hypothetical protein